MHNVGQQAPMERTLAGWVLVASHHTALKVFTLRILVRHMVPQCRSCTRLEHLAVILWAWRLRATPVTPLPVYHPMLVAMLWHVAHLAGR